MIWLSALWGRVQPYLMAAAATVAALGVLIYTGRRQGRLEAETEALRRNADDRRVRDEEDLRAAREPDPVARLRDRWSRD